MITHTISAVAKRDTMDESPASLADLILLPNFGRGACQASSEKNVRIPVLLTIGNDKVFAFVRSANIQAIRLELRKPVRVGDRVEFGFSPPGTSDLISLSAKVVWMDAGGRLAIGLVDTADAEASRLQEWILSTLKTAQTQS